MPFYEYKCRECSHQFERLMTMDSENPRCPLCEGSSDRLIGASNVHFKGKGFHCTDYTKYSRKSR